MQLEFDVNKQIVRRTDSDQVVENSNEYLYAHFNFSEDWDNAIKKVFFVDQDNNVYSSNLNEDNICQVVIEAIKHPYFTLYLEGSLGYKKITTNVCDKIYVRKSGSGEESIPRITEMTSSDNSIEITRDGNHVDIKVNGENILEVIDIVDNVESEDVKKPLSARQGKVLNEKITKEISDEASAREQSINQAKNELQSGIDNNTNKIADIDKLIPNQASEDNKLADKDYVNSSIATNTATFQGTYTNVAQFPTTNVDDNDYCFLKVIDSVTGLVKQFDRYKWNNDEKKWEYEYTLNNSSFTEEQWKAINSGITSGDVAILKALDTWQKAFVQTYENDISDLEQGLQDLDDGKVDKEDGKGLSSNDFTNEEKTKLNELKQVKANEDNPTDTLKSITIDGKVYKIAGVIANPTQIGEPSKLQLLEIDGVQYAMGVNEDEVYQIIGDWFEDNSTQVEELEVEEIEQFDIGTSEDYHEDSDSEIPTTKTVKQMIDEQGGDGIELYYHKIVMSYLSYKISIYILNTNNTPYTIDGLYNYIDGITTFKESSIGCFVKNVNEKGYLIPTPCSISTYTDKFFIGVDILNDSGSMQTAMITPLKSDISSIVDTIYDMGGNLV